MDCRCEKQWCVHMLVPTLLVYGVASELYSDNDGEASCLSEMVANDIEYKSRWQSYTPYSGGGTEDACTSFWSKANTCSRVVIL
jgi:hypothetical protein